ncbi:MAG: DUF1778 domain-containing protein [Rivularia sp. (in: cyanobacteria)]|jgi:uncharacterized protein (DUF1778 family)
MSNQDTVRVTARISASIQEILQKAAELSGATLNQFMVQAALKEAKKIIEDEGLIILSEIDADKVFSLIENAPAPNENLKAAMRKHGEFFSDR